MDLTEILHHLGEYDDPTFRTVSPPIYQSSNFDFKTVKDFRAAMANEEHLPIYTRGANPTVRLLEKKLAALQSTEAALCFGSGSAAVAAAVMNSVSGGDHVICVDYAYSWTKKLLGPFLGKYNVEVTFIDGRDPDSLSKAWKQNTTLLYLESPTSITFECHDIAHFVAEAKKRGVATILDNTYGSLLNHYPVELGVDMIVHSATKFISGHSDVVGGVVCASASRISSIFMAEYMTLGASMSPNDAWLLIRSLRTFEIRMRQAEIQAKTISDYLENHPGVKAVHDPFQESHPDHRLALKQFSVRIPMFSFELNTDKKEVVEAFCNSLKYIRLAVSWGGYESLLLPATVFPHDLYSVSLMRLYIGLEHSDLLISDFENAFKNSGL